MQHRFASPWPSLYIFGLAMTSAADIAPRVAIVHEWLTGMRGGEKCVEALCEIFPHAKIYTLLHTKGSVSPAIEGRPIHTSFIQNLPGVHRFYRYYLPLFPAAIERFDIRDVDVVISSNHCAAKGVRLTSEVLHICYCYTPMRYIWDMYEEYFGKGRAGVLTRAGMSVVRPYLRRWDLRTSANPKFYVAISENVQRRIRTIYHRSSDVIYPPVNVSWFSASPRVGRYYLIVSAFVPYKRIDLAIAAFNRMGKNLVIVGDGPDGPRLRSIAGSNIKFVGWQPDESLRELYADCTALVFPGEEDFGIVPLEAMASGKPVVAFARGGARETVVEGPDVCTGVLFHEQTVEALVDAVERLQTMHFSPEQLRSHAQRFDRGLFKERMKEYVLRRWREFTAGRACV